MNVVSVVREDFRASRDPEGSWQIWSEEESVCSGFHGCKEDSHEYTRWGQSKYTRQGDKSRIACYCVCRRP